MTERRQPIALWGAAVLALTTSCSSTPTTGFDDVRRMVAQRSGAQPVWRRSRVAEELVQDALRKNLVRPLTLQVARKIALLNSPTLQALYEQLGAGEAQRIQAGLLRNPRFGLGLGATTAGQGYAGVGLGFDFLALLTQSARKRVAAARFEALKGVIADRVFGHLADVEKTFRRLQQANAYYALAGREVLRRQARIPRAPASTSARESSRRLRARGGLEFSQAYLAWLKAAAVVSGEREKLNRLLGLWGAHVHWQVDASLPGLPARAISVEQLESLAVSRRLDLLAAKERSRMWVEALKLADDWAWLGGFDAGVMALGVPTHPLALGPQLGVTIPLFDQGQARRDYLRANLRRSWNETTQLGITIRAEARHWGRKVLLLRRRLLVHQEMLLPAARLLASERSRKSVPEHANAAAAPAGDAGALASPTKANAVDDNGFEDAHRGLESDRQRLYRAEREWLRLRCDYWLARAELRRVTAGPVPLAEPAASVSAD